MLEPCTVTDIDPVPARFWRRITFSPPRSDEHVCVVLPPRPPTVITTRRVPRAPCAVRHLTEVSDSHSVDSHAVRPSRARLVYVTSPMLEPCNVTELDPVPARFWRRITISPDLSADKARVMLPPLSPAVITIRRVPRDPMPAWHLTEVSDSHSVLSHPVCPSRARPV